jgi:hypothetical protein
MEKQRLTTTLDPEASRSATEMEEKRRRGVHV